MNSKDFSSFLFIGVLVLLGIMIFNSFNVFSIGNKINDKVDEAKELARPAKIEIITLGSSCEDCFDINSVVSVLKEADLEITGEKSLSGNSQEAKELIQKHGIEKLPTIILEGEIAKATIQSFKESNGALVFDAVAVPYENALTNEVVGKVSAIVIGDKKCAECTDFSTMIEGLKQTGVFIDSERIRDISDAGARDLVERSGIETLPVLLLSRDFDAYTELAANLEQVGQKNADYYVLEAQTPYVEVDTGKIRGLVKLTMLEDPTCVECYNVEIHRQILARFGMFVGEDEKLDISSKEGNALMDKYDIEKIPAVVISGDVEAYPSFAQVWEQVGTIETDGNYIFRNVEVLGEQIIYKDLSTGEVTSPTTQIPEQQTV
ncbi:hypothetical protein ISS07_05645 [Candidatus Woesearchaeota archaeon]|nr:hypothetical protein [Candidatus Woesearchaeota archaeon]